MSIKKYFGIFAWFFFEYDTLKVVTIRNLKIGILNRVVQLLIIAYIVIYVIIYKKGYQDTDIGVSSTTAKLKGISSTVDVKDLLPEYRQLWDVGDYHIPAQQTDAFFVMTNAIITRGQQQGKCAEDTKSGGSKATCKGLDDNSTCTAGVNSASGVMTGKCVDSGKPGANFTCEVFTWCPTQHDVLPERLQTTPLLENAVNFTVLIKNFVSFLKFKVSRRNIYATLNNATYLKNCRFDKDNDPHCPIFNLGYIMKEASVNFAKIGTEGGVISIIIKWDCNLDRSYDKCNPTYSFVRLDNESAKLSPGWNFRFSKNYAVDHIETRDLFKAYGILFKITVDATARKFSFIPLFLNIGSGLALLTLATLICDFIMLKLLKKKKYYGEKKYLNLVDDDFIKFANTDHNPLEASSQGTEYGSAELTEVIE